MTRIGRLELEVPRHRNVPFKTVLFENYQRNEQALISTMMEMVVQGVSTRSVQKVTEELCGESFSKSTVSEICKELDIPIKQFKEKRGRATSFLYVMPIHDCYSAVHKYADVHTLANFCSLFSPKLYF